MKITYEGVLKHKFIKEYISKKYNCSNITVTTVYSKSTVQYHFETALNDKYNIIKKYTILSDDLSDILIEMLREDGIEPLSLVPEFEHVPGDSFEPLDYGTYKYIGFKFTYSSEK